METNSRYQIGVDINSNKCEKERKPAKEKIQIGTMRCLRPENEVADVDSASTTSQSSKISDIMKCMFFRKKETEVVEMKPEKSSASKTKSLTLDRSERSRRVLKMESMRAAPLERETQPPDRPTTPPAAKRFLPSENPTAAFLAYVNPQNRQVRRAYSDVMKASGDQSNKKQLQAKEAFVRKHESERNTNYRANRAIERPGSRKKSQENEDDDQYNHSHSQNAKVNNTNVTVVPGTMLSAEEDLNYHANIDINDLHEEIRRMNMSHTDMVSPLGDLKGQSRRRRREGSISVSGSGSDDSEDSDSDEIRRPKNPVPDADNEKEVKNRSMEEVIDGLYLKTQKKLEAIYHDGIGTLETYRPESSVDDPDMTKFERDLFGTEQPKDSGVETESSVDNADGNISSQDEHNGSRKKTPYSNAVSMKIVDESAKNKTEVTKLQSDTILNSEQNNVDNLLNEVSIWAKDRENWLLGRTELDDKYCESKDKIKLSHKVDFHNDSRSKTDLVTNTDDDEIDRVRASNEQRCNNWVEGKGNTPRCSQRTIDIITSPKMFSPRNHDTNSLDKAVDKDNYTGNTDDGPVKIFSPRNEVPVPSRVTDTDKTVVNKEKTRAPIPSKRTHKGVMVYDYSDKEDEVKSTATSNNSKKKPVSILADKHNEHNKTIINGIVIPTPTFDSETEDERSTICDDLSDLDRKVPYRARSPDSWLSSCGSPTNLMMRPGTDNDFNDSFETVSSLTADSVKVHRLAVASASEPVNQIKQKPHIHAPHRGLDRQGTPMPNDAQHLPLPKSMRNTQLQPLGGSSFRQERNVNSIHKLNSMNGINSLTGLPSMVNDGVLKGTRNLNDFELSMNINTRPFSEIPLSNSETINAMNGNSRFIGNGKYLGGYQSNKQVPVEVVSARPVSETFPVKRTDKVGTGHIMATDSNRERNRYAKEIVHSMERKRQQPQKAFSQEETSDKKPKQNELGFVSQLLQGGYSYDKHSSRRLNSSTETSVNSPGERNDWKTSQSHDPNVGYNFDYKSVPKSSVSSSFKVETKTANEFNKSMKSNDMISPRLNGGYNNTMPRTKGKNNSVFDDIDALSPRDLETPDNKIKVSDIPPPLPEKKRKNKNGVSNVDSFESTAQLNAPQTKDIVRNKQTEQISHGSVSTAQKFRNMRNKRNQEMQWLMKDAAETEV